VPHQRGPISTIVLDFDDTLCLTEASSFVMENEILASMGRAPMSRSAHHASWGMPLHEAIRLRSPGIDVAAFFEAMQPVFAEFVAAGQIDVVTGEDLDALDALLLDGYQLMVLTSRVGAEVTHLLDAQHPLAQRLHGFYHADNITHMKPDPRAFDTLLRDHSLSPAACVYVGDLPGDAAASLGAGMRFIACMQSGVRTRGDFAPYAVDAFVDQFPEIVDTIRTMQTTQQSAF
jgi:phosphoglycolate phosphatase